MLDALIDNSTIVYVLFIIVCSGLLFAWRRTRRRSYLIGTAVGLLLVVGYAVLTHVVITDRQKIIDTINASAKAVEKKDLPTIERGLASDFHLGQENRKTFMVWAANGIRDRNVKDIVVWNFTFDSLDKVKGTAQISFFAKPHGNWSDGYYFRVEGNLVREADGKWKLQTFRVFQPYSDSKSPLPIPDIKQ